MSSLQDTLSALKSVIQSQQDEGHQHEPTATEYFAILSKTISVGAGGDALPNFLRILVGVIPKSSKAIVQSQFKSVGGALLKIVEANADNNVIIGIALESIGVLLQAQECSEGFWGLMPPLQCLNALLSFADSDDASLMKVSHGQLVAILSVHYQQKALAVRGYLTDFCVGVMQVCTRSSYKRTHCVVLLLEKSLCFLPEKRLLAVLELLLRLQQCEVPKLTAAVFRTIDALFQNPYYSFSAEMTLKIASILLKSAPRTFDMEASTFYCTALGSIAFQICNRQVAQLPSMVRQMIQSLIPLCDSEFTEVHCAIGSTLKRTFQYLFEKTVVKKTMPTLLSSSSAAESVTIDPQLMNIFRELVTLLQLRYMPAWLYILDAVRSLFTTFKVNGLALSALKPMVLKLADLYQAVENGSISALDTQLHVALGESLGMALRSVGVLMFLEFVPLKSEEGTHHKSFIDDNGQLQQPIPTSREWIITMLHSQLKQMPCDIAEFGKSILPLANEYYHAVKALQNSANRSDSAIQIMKTRISQLWSLLPEFCYFNVKDVPESLPKLAGIMERTFSDEEYPELVPHVVRTLHNLARNISKQHPNGTATDSSPALASFQSTMYKFLPLMLQYIEHIPLDDPRFKDGVDSISAMVRVAPVALVEAISKKLMQLVLTSTTTTGDDASAAGWMAVMLAMIPELPNHLVILLFKAVQPLLVAVETSSVQKRSYHLLVSLLEHHRDVVLQHTSALEIMKSIRESLFTCHVSARTMRLRAMAVLLSDMEALDLKQVVDMIFQELLSCLKDPNKKSRDAAMELLVFFIEYLTAEDLWTPLTAALFQGLDTDVMDVDSDTVVSTKRDNVTHLRSAAITGLCLLIVKNRDHSELLNEAVSILPGICAFGKMECPHLTKSMLGFIRVFVSTQPIPSLHSNLPMVIAAFTGHGLGSTKSKFSSRCHAIMRKLLNRIGEEILRQHVPPSDTALLDYVCRQARKADRKKAAATSSSSLREEVEHLLGSDSEDDDAVPMDDGKLDTKGQNSQFMQNSALLESIRSVAAMRTNNSSDYRLAQRPKATRASDMYQSALPNSLDDLLEDQAPILSVQRGTSKSSKRLNVDALNGRGRGVHRDIDDDENRFNVVVTKDGKVVVKELEHDTASLSTSKPRESSILNNDTVMDQDNIEGAPNQLHQVGRFQNQGQEESKKRKLNLREPGAEYRSKKAGGDVWKKGMLEPYAYIPLDPRLLSKRHKTEAVEHFGAVVKNKRKGKHQQAVRGRSATSTRKKR